MQKKSKHIFSKIVIGMSILFFYLPILYIIVFSFNGSRSLTKLSGFSLQWYQKMFSDGNMMSSLGYTFLVAIIATAVSTVFGTVTAIGLSKSGKGLRAAVERINDLPVMNPDIVTGIGLLMMFAAIAVTKGFWTMLLAHIMFCTPYVILSVMPKLRTLDPNLTDAALDLGATPFQAMTKVIIPQIKPGIISGALIAFTMSFDDFVISYFVTGNGVQNISILVYTMSKRVNPSINALSSLVILIITVSLILVNVVPMLKKKVDEDEIEDNKKSLHSRNQRRIALAASAGILVIAVGAGFAANLATNNAKRAAAIEKYGSATLKVYLPGEYISESLVPDFENEFGVDVIIENFDSNEMMYAKVQAGDSYDVLIPSDYMIERLLKQDMLQPIDRSVMTNLDQLTDAVVGMSYDPDNIYSVPYFWGNVGIVYNTNTVDEDTLEEQGFSILKNTDYNGRIFWYDSERDSFMIALKALGYSMNTESVEEINEAYQWLLEMNDTMDPTYVTDEVIDAMCNGLKDMAVVYSGDATYILDENEDMGFWAPEEGTNIWVDAMVIPKNAENPALASEFINYVLNYDVSYANSDYVGYASPNANVLDEMSGEGGIYEENAAYLPRMDYPLDEVFHDNEIIRQMISEYWIKVKAN